MVELFPVRNEDDSIRWLRFLLPFSLFLDGRNEIENAKSRAGMRQAHILLRNQNGAQRQEGVEKIAWPGFRRDEPQTCQGRE